MEKTKRFKKEVYDLSPRFLDYLKDNKRLFDIPLSYETLLRFSDGLPIYNKEGEDSLWLSVLYPPEERAEIDQELKKIYSALIADGGEEVLPFLNIDSIDFCTFGNTKPFRIKVRNIINDNYVYFYVKQVDASRVYGLELEDILSPNQVNYLVEEDTLIEEHISGIPGDIFIEKYLEELPVQDKKAVAKEFVKFNERCFVRLLGDMRSYNYVVVLTHDFDRIQYRFRAIDFDQQNYEGDSKLYKPEYFEENSPLRNLELEYLAPGSIDQYRREERALIAKRATSNVDRLTRLLNCMMDETLSTEEHFNMLQEHLVDLTQDKNFIHAKTMGGLLESALKFVIRNYETLNLYIKK